MNKTLSVVIPAFNEAATIGSVVANAIRYGVPVVVDDGSVDNTGDVARSAGAKVIRHSVNLGYDRALDSGFALAAELGCDYVVTMDADGQHDAEILAQFIHALDEGAELVVGIRGRSQRVAETIFGWVARARWGILDPLCGMKGYRIGLYRDLGHFDSYGSIGTELAIFAAKSGRRIAQIPVKTGERSGAPRFASLIAANRRILRALWIGLRTPPRH